MIYNLFEQSGTFKKEEIKLGFNAVDVDILNNFNETDFQVDLFKEIENAYEEKPSFFDRITENDLCFAFFPCTKFTEKIFVNAKANNSGMKKWSDLERVEYSMHFIEEVNHYYSLFCKMYAVALKRKLKLIIENPYPGKQHYLEMFFPFDRTFIDRNRAEHYDYYKKPTGYWFVNFELREHLQLVSTIPNEKPLVSIPNSKKALKDLGINGTERELRSLISPKYARWFLKSFVEHNLPKDNFNEVEDKVFY